MCAKQIQTNGRLDLRSELIKSYCFRRAATVTAFSASPAAMNSGAGWGAAGLLLVSTLSASESKQGESFEAILQEPMRQNDHLLLPEGCVFHGHVARLAPPRRLSRAGSAHQDGFRGALAHRRRRSSRHLDAIAAAVAAIV
jgi:hypothetical protein